MKKAKRYQILVTDFPRHSGRDEMNAQIIKELMAQYNEKRKEWISEKGNDEGFDEWFTVQVMEA